MSDKQGRGPGESPAGSPAAEILALLHQGAQSRELAALLEPARLPAALAARERWAAQVRMGLAIRERFELHQQRERGLMALIETAQDLTAITDLDRVLQAIVQRARKLVGCDVGYLSIYDAERGDFYVRATEGAFSERFKQIRVALDVGICGFVARNKAPYCSSEYGSDSRFAHTPQIDTAVLEEHIQSILGVPLLAAEQVIGVLFVGDRYVRAYAAWEMSILSTLAAHASVAIGNARLFEQAQSALEQASRTNAQLSRQTAETRQAAEAHERLTALVAQGGDLKSVCGMVAAMLQGHVAVHDEGGQQVCCATHPDYVFDESGEPSAGDRHYWRTERIHAALGKSRMLGRSVMAYEQPGEVCRACAVIGGRGMLGGLVIHTAQALADVAVRIFERSSMVCGVLLLSQERSAAAARAELPVLLRDLLDPGATDRPALAAAALRHGLDLSEPLCVLLVDMGANASNASIPQKLRDEPWMAGALGALVHERLVVICPARSASTFREALQKFCVKYLRTTVRAVMSVACAAEALAQAYCNAGRCLGLLGALGRTGRICSEQELAPYAVLFQGRDRRDIELFLAAALGGLYRDGVPRRVELARSLLAYFDHGHNARAAAGALGIHINTLRQRLETIEGLLPEWCDPGRMPETHMALKLWRLADDWDFSA